MAPATAHEGHISAVDAYTIEDAMARMRWGIGALRAARQRGLVTYRLGKRTYVTGKALIEFIEKQGKVV